MRLTVHLIGLLAVLLLIPAGATPATAVATPGLDEIVLAGRNCGGTSSPGSLAGVPQATFGGAGWSVGGALDAPPPAAQQLRPSIAVGPTGQVYYAWQETRAGDAGDIFAAALGASPPAGRRAVRVDDTGAAAVEQAAPSLAVDGAGALHVVWEDLRGGGSKRLYYASSADGGASWGANTLLTGALPALSHSSPHLLAGPGGALYLAWDGGNTIYFSRRTAGSWGAPTPISGAPAADRDLPRLALDAQGRLVAAWEDRRGPTPAIYAARLDNPAAGAWGAEVRVTPAGVSAVRPSLAAGTDGALYVAYQGAPGIFLVSSLDGGATWGPARRIDDGEGGAFTNPRVAVDDEGRVHCIWCQLQINVVADVVAASSPDGGATWGGRAVLASTTGTAEPLELIAGDGGLYAAWADDGTSRLILHTARWSPGTTIYLPEIRR